MAGRSAARASISASPAVRSVAAIFGAPVHQGPGWYVNSREGTRSLGTIQPAEISHVAYEQNQRGKWDYRLAFTGTHFRSGGDELAMQAVCSQVLYQIPIPYLVEHGYLALKPGATGDPSRRVRCSAASVSPIKPP